MVCHRFFKHNFSLMLLSEGFTQRRKLQAGADCGRFSFADFQFLSSRKAARTESKISEAKDTHRKPPLPHLTGS
jgi:hypothetical protein